MPTTRSHSELEEDDAERVISAAAPSLSYLHPSSRALPPLPPHRDVDADSYRARKRPRVDSLSSVTSIDRSLLSPEDHHQHQHHQHHHHPYSSTPAPATHMRLTDNDADSTLSDGLPEAGPSSTPALANGHNGIVKGNGFAAPFANGNGRAAAADGRRAERHGAAVARVSLPGTTLYDDSYVDREEFVRLVIQSLRDVGYM